MLSRAVIVAVGQASLLWAMRARLGRRGGAAALACTAVLDAAVAYGLRRCDGHRLGPADAVTLGRASLACAIAGLTVSSRAGAAGLVAPLSTVALALDGLDGQIARRTGTASAFGARFDGEVDAGLILVLSLHAARSFGGWVTAGGIARYAFGAAGRMLPWMRRRLPARDWRKVAAATEGIALAAAASSLVPRRLAQAGLVAGLVLIAESFGRDVVWLWRARREPG